MHKMIIALITASSIPVILQAPFLLFSFLTTRMGWYEYCSGRPNTKHAMINTPACPYCGAANPQKAKLDGEQRAELKAEPTQDDKVIDLTGSSPPTSPPLARNKKTCPTYLPFGCC